MLIVVAQIAQHADNGMTTHRAYMGACCRALHRNERQQITYLGSDVIMCLKSSAIESALRLEGRGTNEKAGSVPIRRGLLVVRLTA